LLKDDPVPKGDLCLVYSKEERSLHPPRKEFRRPGKTFKVCIVWLNMTTGQPLVINNE
jgi:hypothetical protein